MAVISQQEKRLATKDDIALVQSDVALVRHDLGAAGKERSTLKWMVGLFGTLALGGIITILVVMVQIAGRLPAQ